MVARAFLSFPPALFPASGESPAKSNYSRTYAIPRGGGIYRFPCQTNSLQRHLFAVSSTLSSSLSLFTATLTQKQGSTGYWSYQSCFPVGCRLSTVGLPFLLPALPPLPLPSTVETTVSRYHGRKTMMLITIVAVFGLLLVGLVLWVLIQNTQDQKKNQQMESQMNEMRRDLLNLSTTQAQSATKLEPIAGTVATRLEAVTTALKDGVKDSAQITSKLTSESQAAMSLELKNTREQISQIQNQLGEVQQAGKQMFETAHTLENILGGAKSRGSLGEITLERLLEDSLAPSQYARQYRFRSGEAADAVIFLLDKKKMAIDSKFPLDAYRRLSTEGEEARRAFVTAVKSHADSISKKYIVPDEDTLELALMFVPSETVFYELLMSTDGKGQPLDEYCRGRSIFPVSPNTLHANLRVIAMGLRGMQIEENAKHLSANLNGLRKQLDTFTEYFEKIGTHLKNAQQSYTEADKRFDKASNTLDSLVGASESAAPAIEDAQGTLALPESAAKKSA